MILLCGEIEILKPMDFTGQEGGNNYAEINMNVMEFGNLTIFWSNNKHFVCHHSISAYLQQISLRYH